MCGQLNVTLTSVRRCVTSSVFNIAAWAFNCGRGVHHCGVVFSWWPWQSQRTLVAWGLVCLHLNPSDGALFGLDRQPAAIKTHLFLVLGMKTCRKWAVCKAIIEFTTTMSACKEQQSDCYWSRDQTRRQDKYWEIRIRTTSQMSNNFLKLRGLRA